jgi:hypothetical protein
MVPGLVQKLLFWCGLAALAASLALPVGYGAELIGLMYGWMLVSVAFPFAPVYAVPLLGAVVVGRRPVVAMVLAGLGLAGWVFLSVTGGFMIDAFWCGEKVFASGLVLGLLGSAGLFASAWVRLRTPRVAD